MCDDAGSPPLSRVAISRTIPGVGGHGLGSGSHGQEKDELAEHGRECGASLSASLCLGWGDYLMMFVGVSHLRLQVIHLELAGDCPPFEAVQAAVIIEIPSTRTAG